MKLTRTLYIYAQETANEPHFIRAIEAIPVYGGANGRKVVIYELRPEGRDPEANPVFAHPRLVDPGVEDIGDPTNNLWTDFDEAKRTLSLFLARSIDRLERAKIEMQEAYSHIEDCGICGGCGKVIAIEDGIGDEDDTEILYCEPCDDERNDSKPTAAEAADLLNDIERNAQ